MRHSWANISPWQYYKFILIVSSCLFVQITLKIWFVERSVSLNTNDYFISNHTMPFKIPVNQSIQLFEKLIPSPLESLFDVGRTVKYVNCRQVFNGNLKVISEAVQASGTTHENKDSEYYISMANNCTNFINNRNYINDSLTTEEESFPIAFSILLYRDIEQFERLLRAIYRPQNSYCVHVDVKSDKRVFDAVKTISTCFQNVYIPSSRLRVKWGGMSVLMANLICMRELCERNKFWKYMINLTGQEFPLKTNYELVKILKAFQGANDVGLARRPPERRWNGQSDPPHGIKPVKGSLLIAACRGFVEYAVYDQRAKDFLKWLRHTIVPDETFFASLNSNPHLEVPGSSKVFVDRVSRRDIFVAHYVNWVPDTCQGKMLREICVLGVGDLPELANTKTLFANKFHWDYQRAAYECLEELIYNRTRMQFLNRQYINTSFYEKLEFVKNRKGSLTPPFYEW